MNGECSFDGCCMAATSALTVAQIKRAEAVC